MSHPNSLLRGLRSQERGLVQELLGKGWTLRTTGSGHLHLMHPDGHHSVTFPRSPSDWRGWKNMRATVRRIERAVELNQPLPRRGHRS